jgi:6-pyruvoyltetrahydropterin/6-carboxytetrahydropterin synthase
MEFTGRKFEFDAAHRVVDQTSKCRNLHGHRYVLEATFAYYEKAAIGYPIDFTDIKRVLGGFIDLKLDHGTFLNPTDSVLIQACVDLGSKAWLMGNKVPQDIFEEPEYINPTAENIVVELGKIAFALFREHPLVTPNHFTLYETPNCWVEHYVPDYKLMPQNIDGEYLRQADEFLNTIGGFIDYDSRNKK